MHVMPLSEIVLNRHELAVITLIGQGLDVMGGLYLAYDLLGGSRGSLRVLTRIVTYALFFLLGYGLTLGPAFGFVVGGGFGLALGLEYGYGTSKHPKQTSSVNLPLLLLGMVRGFTLGMAACLTYGWKFGVTFGLLATSGIIIQYVLGFSPTREYPEASKLSLRRQPVVAALIRSLFTGCAAILAGLVTTLGGNALLVGLNLGLVVGLVSIIVSIIAPVIEWWVDYLPGRLLGIFGMVLLLIGVVLQSLQYWIVVFDVPVR